MTKKFAKPKILLLNVELKLKSEKENAEVYILIQSNTKVLLMLNGKSFIINFMCVSLVEQTLFYLSYQLVIWQPNTLLTEVFSAQEVLKMATCREQVRLLAEPFRPAQTICLREFL